MFCQKCWAEFRDDNPNCIYCGAPRPEIDEWELDWEDAARLREQQENSLLQAPVLSGGANQSRHKADDCVRPGNPPRTCGACGKEIPASAKSSLCANCRASQERKKNEVKKRLAEQTKKQRELDAKKHQQNTQARDQCIRPNDQPRVCSSCQKALPASSLSDLCAVCSIRAAGNTKRESSMSSGYQPSAGSAPATAKKAKPAGCFVTIISIIILFNVVLPALGNVVETVLDRFSSTRMESAVSVSEIEPAEDFYISDASEDMYYEEDQTDYDAYYFYDDIKRTAPELATEEEIYRDYVFVATQDLLGYVATMLSEEEIEPSDVYIQTDSSQMYLEGEYWMLSGSFYFDLDSAETPIPFTIGLLLYDSESYEIPYLEIDGEIIWDA